MRSALTICRDERESAGVRAVLALVRERAEGLRKRLTLAPLEEVARLQGAVLTLESLARDIESNPVQADRRDGAYA